MMGLLRILLTEIPVRALRASANKLRHARLRARIRKTVRFGSKPALTTPKRDFRNTPESRHSQGQSVPGPVMRSRRASAPGPADDCFSSVRRGARPQGRRTKAKRTGDGCLTPEKSSARQESCKPKSTAPRDQGAHHFPTILSTKRQRSNLMSANEVRRPANLGL